MMFASTLFVLTCAVCVGTESREVSCESDDLGSGQCGTSSHGEDATSLLQTKLTLSEVTASSLQTKSFWSALSETVRSAKAVDPVPAATVSTQHPEDLVNLLAGTETKFQNWENRNLEVWRGSVSNGNALPQIKMPWGFNDWAPQTRGEEDGEAGGGSRGAFWFNPKDTKFQGIRCTHEPSPWLGDYAHFLVQPHTDSSTPRDFKWSVDKSVLRPYLFSTDLEGTKLEFAPTSHAALLQVTFPEGANAGHISLRVADGELKIDGDRSQRTVRGRTTTNPGDGVPKGWLGMYFTMKAMTKTKDQQASLLEVARDDTFHNGQRGTLSFDPKQGPVLVALATSFISQEQSDLNLEQEVGSKSFQQVMNAGRETWAKQLNRVQVDALDNDQLKTFYTNLWKAQLFPRYLQEVNAAGEEVHRSPYTQDVRKGKLVADSGFWDAYSTVYPLQSMLFADNMGGLIDGWVDAYKEAKWLPQWASPGERNMMVSTMGDVSLADAIAKSKWGYLTGFNVSKAYDAIRKDAFSPRSGQFGREGLANYIENGFVDNSVSESVSRSLNYYVCDAAISRAAGILGKHDDEKLLADRSKRYTVLFNPETNFFQPKRSDGVWQWTSEDSNGGGKYFNPESYDGFTEASAWQYRFYVPHDVDGLKKLYGGKLCDAIQSMLSYEHPNMADVRIPEVFGLYTHGNQPVHHILYVAKKAGCNELADKSLRQVMQKLYTTDSWAGDEDNGEMASWYILSALGVYSLEGAKDELVLGSPAIKHATVQLANQKMLKVDTENQAHDHPYVQSVTWTPTAGTAQTIQGNVIKFTDLMQGGILSFKMGAHPKRP